MTQPSKDNTGVFLRFLSTQVSVLSHCVSVVVNNNRRPCTHITGYKGAYFAETPTWFEIKENTPKELLS